MLMNKLKKQTYKEQKNQKVLENRPLPLYFLRHTRAQILPKPSHPCSPAGQPNVLGGLGGEMEASAPLLLHPR